MKLFNITKLVLSSILVLALFACNKEPADIGTVPEDYDLTAAIKSLSKAPETTAQKAQTLEEAIQTDDKGSIVYLLKQEKANPNQKTAEGDPLLILAARRGFAFAVEQLLAAGANVNAIDEEGKTALMNLYQEDYYFSDVDTDYNKVRDLLLDAGADVNMIAKGGWSANRTALRGASYVGEVDDVKKLLEAGANVNAKNEDGMTTLDWACMGMDSTGEDDEKDKNEIVRLLLKAGAKGKENALEIALDSSFPKIANTIFNSGIDTTGKTGESLLRTASRAGMLEMVKMLLANKVDVNSADKRGETALVYAVDGSINHIEGADRVSVVKALLAAGANVNIKNKDGHSLLWLAEFRNEPEIVELLKSAGAKN